MYPARRWRWWKGLRQWQRSFLFIVVGGLITGTIAYLLTR
jgi:hypothetical protein